MKRGTDKCYLKHCETSQTDLKMTWPAILFNLNLRFAITGKYPTQHAGRTEINSSLTRHNWCWLILENRGSDESCRVYNNILMILSRVVLFHSFAFKNIIKEYHRYSAKLCWRLSFCSRGCWTWHTGWNNRAGIKISSLSLTHSRRQLRSVAELSSTPPLWLQIIFFTQRLLWYRKNRLVALFASSASALSCCVTIPCLDSIQTVTPPAPALSSQPSQMSTDIEMSAGFIVQKYNRPTFSSKDDCLDSSTIDVKIGKLYIGTCARYLCIWHQM